MLFAETDWVGTLSTMVGSVGVTAVLGAIAYAIKTRREGRAIERVEHREDRTDALAEWIALNELKTQRIERLEKLNSDSLERERLCDIRCARLESWRDYVTGWLTEKGMPPPPFTDSSSAQHPVLPIKKEIS